MLFIHSFSQFNRRCPSKMTQIYENYKEAIQLCSDAIDIEPNDPKGYYCRGTALSEMGKSRKTYKDLIKAIELPSTKKTYIT